MLSLVFELDGERFAIDAAAISEVLPFIGITRIPQAPAGIAGVCDRHGTPVPVIDLSLLLLGRPAERRLSTRMLIVDYVDATGAMQRLALIAEKATSLIRQDASAFVSSGVRSRQAPYLGEVVSDAGRLIQRIDVNTLLPDAVREALFGAGAHG